MRKRLATPIHISWIVLAGVTVMLFAAGYNMATTIDRQARDIHYLNAEIDDLERYVPAYAACKEAAEIGHELSWAWHDWLNDQTQRHVDRVHELQDEQGEQLAACSLDEDEGDEQAEIVGAVAR